MENMSMVQARTPEKLKENAAEILDQLGLNLSTYINMALKQLVIQNGIPFDVKLSPASYNIQESVDEVEATMRMEGFKLSDEELDLLRAYRKGEVSGDALRKKIIEEV